MKELLLIINEWLLSVGGFLLVLNGFIFLVSIKRGLKFGEFLVPAWVFYLEIEKYIRPERIFFVKYSAISAVSVFMTGVLLFVFRVIIN